MIGQSGKRGLGFLAILAIPAIAACFAGCSYVNPMSPKLKKAVAARDTIYVMPGKAYYATLGFLFDEPDSARMQAIRDHADEILPEEIRRVFPSATVLEVPPGGEDSILALAGGATIISCEVSGFKRTVPREVVSEALNVLLMVPTFALNLGYPIHTTSNVWLKVRKPGATKVVRLKHRDMVNSFDREELRFQIRILLDPSAKA